MATDQERWIEYRPLASITGALRNPKGHVIEDLRESFRRFGFTVAPLMDERTGRLMTGHGRVIALRLEQSEDKPAPQGIRDTGDDWHIPIIRGVASANDAEAEAYLIADNRLTEVGGWDDADLVDMLTSISESPNALTGLGFSSEDLIDLMARVAGPPSLDDLAALHGDHDPKDLWPVLRVQVPPHIRDAFYSLRQHDDEEDGEILARLLIDMGTALMEQEDQPS